MGRTASQPSGGEMIHLPEQRARVEGRRGRQAPHVQRQVRLSAVNRSRRRECSKYRLHWVAKLWAESSHRRMRERNARGDMVNEETVRAKDEVRKTHRLPTGRKQDRHGPVVKLISVPKPKGLEVGNLTRQG